MLSIADTIEDENLFAASAVSRFLFMKYIELTKGKRAVVDDEEYDTLNAFKWYAQKGGINFYACRRSYGKLIFMHRSIMCTPKGMETDHINGDSLDNRRVNLRICTSSENHMNRGKNHRNTSGFKGVSFHKKNKKWIARISIHGKYKHLGIYSTPNLAYEAYCDACLAHHGEFANIGK